MNRTEVGNMLTVVDSVSEGKSRVTGQTIYSLVTYALDHINDAIILYLYEQDGVYVIEDDGNLTDEFNMQGKDVTEQTNIMEQARKFRVSYVEGSFATQTLDKEGISKQVMHLIQFLTLGYNNL